MLVDSWEELQMKSIDDLMGHVRNRIRAVGIELEGGWHKLPPGIHQVEHDGSVRFGSADITRHRLTQVGEIVSHPIEAKKEEPRWTEMEKWVAHNYPQAANGTCGMHVHFSFRSHMNYQRLMVPELTEETVRLLTKWAETEKLPQDHPLWSRLRGESEYCQRKFMAAEQSKQTRKNHARNGPGHRYTMWNYCYGQHSTIECRLLPMMETSDQAIRAIHYLINLVNAFLVVHLKREEPRIAQLTAEESLVIPRYPDLNW
jgi:hypothetical protein